MATYRYTIKSESMPSVHTSQIVRTTSARTVISKAKHVAESVRFALNLPPGDVRWAVFKVAGHIGGWDIIAHNDDERGPYVA